MAAAFRAQSPQGPHVILSGRVDMTDKTDPPFDVAVDVLVGTSDEKYETYEVHLIVGPWWGA